MKNITTRQLSAITAFILALSAGILVYALEKNWLWAALSAVAFFTLAYFVFLFVLEKFIYRKLKLIYKLIYQVKASHKEETYYKYVLPKKSIDDVGDDVEAWAEESTREIELLRQNEKFRREFLQNLSHEFKTPVFAIQGYIDTLLGGALSNPDVNTKFLEKAAKNVERLSHLLNDLDQISRLERGELILDKRYFVIQELVKEVFETVSIKADALNINCLIKKGCESPLIVFADKEKLRQVFVNLVENSIKYGKQDGTITASMYNTDGKNILVEITDDGIGIQEKHLARLFERFYRTEEGRALDVTGSGLGLAICKHIIEAHGHSIHVRSKEGVGTTVGFTIDHKKD